jgi:hypothetical protein
VLFGTADDGVPRGARFPEDDQLLVAGVAVALGLRLGVATKPAHFQVVHKLPVGQLNATGNNTVPKIEKRLYEQLIGLVGGDVGKIIPKPPKSADEVAPGHVVLAHESIVDGWFEAICVKREGRRLIVRWRDYPTIPPFERDIESVTLLIGA